ncbi:MarR family winged helix-turn-helix transcriptional regulator [Nonomuraea sp. NPDC049400]|uniref:MarR family winged helix-turn-helix transcriptional regulator n=1 Tax=Nonomuraea sp. NPDC049400 TaxID=3364352 RepID=UPI0037A7C911
MTATDVTRPPARLCATPSWLITQTATHAARLVSEAFGTVGGRRYHYALLAALEEFGPASQAELGRRCSIDRSYVVEAVNELTDKGFAVRAPDPADRRRNIITITPAGERELERIAATLDVAQDKLLAPLSSGERKQLTQLMARVLDHHTHR